MEKEILPHFHSFPLVLFSGDVKCPLGKLSFSLGLLRSDREGKAKMTWMGEKQNTKLFIQQVKKTLQGSAKNLAA